MSPLAESLCRTFTATMGTQHIVPGSGSCPMHVAQARAVMEDMGSEPFAEIFAVEITWADDANSDEPVTLIEPMHGRDHVDRYVRGFLTFERSMDSYRILMAHESRTHWVEVQGPTTITEDERMEQYERQWPDMMLDTKERAEKPVIEP